MSKRFVPQARAILQVVFDGFADTARDTPRKIIPVLPKACTIHKNSYSQADSWDLTFDASDLPIDPDLIRAAAAEIFLFQLPGLDEQRIVNRQTNSLAAPAGELQTPGLILTQQQALQTSMLAALNTIELEQRREEAIRRFTYSNRPLIAGQVDEPNLEMSESGRTMSLQGQDYTAYLIEKQWPPRKGRTRPIPTGRRLDVALLEILEMADPGGEFLFELRGIVPADLRTLGKHEVRGNRKGINVGQNTSYWDVMSGLARRHGLILFVDGLNIVLSRPQNITGKDAGRIRKMVWGRNLDSLQLRRKLGKEQVPQIRVQGYDEKSRKAIEVRFPEKGDPVPSGIGVKRDEYQLVPAYGITDKAVLREMAESLFHRMGRSERAVTFSTKDLRDMHEDDLLNLGAGDPFEIEFSFGDPDDLAARQLLSSRDVPAAQKIRYLTSLGYGEAISETIALHYDKLEMLRRPLRVKEVSYSYDSDSGISIECQCTDFIVVNGQQGRVSAAERHGTVSDSD